MIKLVHLSDIHFEKNPISHPQTRLIEALIADLEGVVDKDTLLIITGDLLDKGGIKFNDGAANSFNEFKKCVLDELVSHYPELSNKILFVPGNHDIERNRIDQIKYKGLQSSADDSYEDFNEIVKSGVASNDYLEQLSLFKKFEADFHSSNKDYDFTYMHSTTSYKFDDVSVGVACLNSSWLCIGDSDFSKLALGRFQVEQAVEKLSAYDLKIALLHHPLDFLRHDDKEQVTPILYKNFDVILTGHTHKVDSGYYQNLNGDVLISISQSILTQNHLKDHADVGYSIVEVFPKDQYVLKFKKYLSEHEKFVINTDIGNDRGEKEFKIPNTYECKIDSKVNSIINTLKVAHLESMNNDLIIYNADDNIPNCIDDIFVSPTICNFLENQCDCNEDDEIIKYEIDDILNGKSNYLVYGPKESGKTIYLDKVVMDSICSFRKYKKVPVHIRFEDIGNHDIIQIIRNFLSITKDEFVEIYNRYSVVLLIDNILFPDEANGNKIDFHNIKKIVKFIKGYPNVQIIATSNQIAENVLPIEHFEYNQHFDFCVAFLHTLKTAQIKTLIRKWFTKKDIDFHSNLEKMFNNFKDLGLPKTPLSVTMFLWIINKQETEPVNNAVLVEIFIENLLEKANFSNAFSGSFDFYNKKRLLTRFSKFMFDEGDCYRSYSVSYEDALGFFKEYLKNKFGNPKEILDNLIERRILMYTEGYQVRFKSAFFFHYFLSANIDSDEDFKKFVFDNFLDFSSELEFYTGLNRDSEEILDLVVSALKEDFQDINNVILPEPKKIDTFFETKDPLSKHIDINKAKNKPTEKQIEEAYDERLDLIPVKNDIKPKEFDRKASHKLDRLLKLASVILRNSEEIDDFEKRYQSFKIIMQSSISFLVLYRQYMMDYYEKHKEKPMFFPKNLDFSFFVRFLPLIHQVVLYDWMGSIKLSPLLIRKMEEDSRDKDVSVYERFLSIFIYSDIGGHNYKKFINDFTYNIDKNYILDSVFFKILSYYYLRQNSKDLDEMYLTLLATLQVKRGSVSPRKKEQARLKIKYFKTKQKI